MEMIGNSLDLLYIDWEILEIYLNDATFTLLHTLESRQEPLRWKLEHPVVRVGNKFSTEAKWDK